VFVTHAEERFTWEKKVAGQVVGGEHGVPILWRGCSFGCLDHLQPAETKAATAVAEAQGDGEDDFDAQFMELDDLAGGGTVAFTSEGFEFDDD
jgi:hypothetical protein